MSNTYDRVSGKVMEVKQKEYEKQIRNIKLFSEEIAFELRRLNA